MTDWTRRYETIRERDYSEAARSVMAGDRDFLLDQLAQSVDALRAAEERVAALEALVAALRELLVREHYGVPPRATQERRVHEQHCPVCIALLGAGARE